MSKTIIHLQAGRGDRGKCNKSGETVFSLESVTCHACLFLSHVDMDKLHREAERADAALRDARRAYNVIWGSQHSGTPLPHSQELLDRGHIVRTRDELYETKRHVEHLLSKVNTVYETYVNQASELRNSAAKVKE